ncbi:uncharacterized protein LOC143921063 [Arctopsyche grandis]|uniref:uncharacterized protein LOC143921063 n=1 Tax=Arctopsyche grandis TaxID=121162 RepID=UPI00406D7BF0
MECRLCLHTEPAPSSISIHTNKSLVESIHNCSQLWIKKFKGMPNTICQSCNSNIKMFNSFKNACIRNDKISRAKAEGKNVKSEEVILDDLVWENESACIGLLSRNNVMVDIKCFEQQNSSLEGERLNINKLLVTNESTHNITEGSLTKSLTSNFSDNTVCVAPGYQHNIDTKKLIIEVSKKKCLWDSTANDFKNRETRLTSWLEIAAKLVRNYDSLNEEDKKRIISKVQYQWKHARDCYNKTRLAKRHLKSDSETELAKTYIFYEHLRFLDKLKESEVLPLTKASIESSKKLKAREIKRRKFENDADFKNKLYNSDIEFFQSTLPIVRELNEQEKFLFRSNVIDELLKIKHKKARLLK